MRIFFIALALALVPACSCQRQATEEESSSRAPEPTTAVAPAASSQATPGALRQRAQRAQTMRDAVDVVHDYLAKVGSGQFEQADAYWAYKRSPGVDEEGGLRKLAGLRSLRINNSAAKPLDEEPVPQLVKVPVQLRAILDEGSVLRYRGWYRLRYNPVETRWELSAVSLHIASSR